MKINFLLKISKLWFRVNFSANDLRKNFQLHDCILNQSMNFSLFIVLILNPDLCSCMYVLALSSGFNPSGPTNTSVYSYMLYLLNSI